MSKAIGDVPCDRKGCAGKCSVFKFGSGGEQKRGSPFTGRMWMKCNSCGRVSGREGSQAVTDYILENGTIWAEKSSDGEQKNEPTPEPKQPAQVTKKTASQPTQAQPTQPTPEPSKPWWKKLPGAIIE
jgi:hypothetical protein